MRGIIRVPDISNTATVEWVTTRLCALALASNPLDKLSSRRIECMPSWMKLWRANHWIHFLSCQCCTVESRVDRKLKCRTRQVQYRVANMSRFEQFFLFLRSSLLGHTGCECWRFLIQSKCACIVIVCRWVKNSCHIVDVSKINISLALRVSFVQQLQCEQRMHVHCTTEMQARCHACSVHFSNK